MVSGDCEGRRGWRGEGRHKACPYGDGEGIASDGGEGSARAGTRPAPTGTGRGWRDEGRHKACPYGSGERDCERRRGWRGEGRHEACPYGDGEGIARDGGEGGARAGTRPAPMGTGRGEGPTVQLQGSVVSGRGLRLTCLSVCGGMVVV